MEVGFSVNFGSDRAGLATVQRAWFDNTGTIIGTWGGVVSELQSDSGIYWIYEDPPGAAEFIGWRSGESDEAFAGSTIAFIVFAFNFNVDHSGKTVLYQFLSASGTPLTPETSDDIIEMIANSGVYFAFNVTIPEIAIFIRARTSGSDPAHIGGVIDRPEGGIYAIPRDKAFIQEVH